MTKDELNEVLKEDGLILDKQFDGTGEEGFTLVNLYMESYKVINFDKLGFTSKGKFYLSTKALQALSDYANTPIEERKPKPQLYNIIIAKDTVRNGFYLTAWQKESGLGEYFVNNCVRQHDLLHNDDLKFTVEEIEDLKSKVSEKQKQIIDIGTVKIEDTMSTGIDIDEVEDE